ncbi:MAG TPA: hypothetical protein VEP67_04195 [Thiobacillaceae bacterium]|nr:hypothetical protein [Thiobacillaceae bacterium]
MSPEARKLLDCFRRLSADRQSALLDFAEYLAGKEAHSRQSSVPAVPLDIPRPENESVIKAVRRLRETYPMLDQNRVFSDVSSLMTRHVMHGAPAAEVIDELEVVFRRHYETHITGSSATPGLPDNSSS